MNNSNIKSLAFVLAGMLAGGILFGLIPGLARPSPNVSSAETETQEQVVVQTPSPSVAEPEPASEPTPQQTKEPEPTQTPVPEETPYYVPIPEELLPQPDKPSGTVTVVGPELITPDTPAVAGEEQTDNAVADKIFSMINEERARENVAPLIYNKKLQDAADLRAKECAVLFSHTRPDGTSCHSVVTEDYYMTGENLIKADKAAASPAGLVFAWMSSAGHRQNIMTPSFTDTAIGVYEKDEVVYVCQIFLG